MTGFLARLHGCCAMVLLAFPMAAAAQSKQPDGVVYKGVWTYELDYQQSWKTTTGNVTESWQKITIDHTYVIKSNEIVSRKITWSASGHEVTPEWETVTCNGQGELELVGLRKEERRQKLAIPCTVNKEKRGSGSWVAMWGGFHIAREISPPRIVGWNELSDGCSFEEERTIEKPGGRIRIAYSVRVLQVPGAVLEVRKDEYGKFVPRPGIRAHFHARAPVPVLFRFKLEEVSHFPGYATNANIDDAFFRLPRLWHFKGSRYPNDGPDLVFDPNDFEDTEVWKRSRWNDVETVLHRTGVDVAVTAMDYGAHGRLRAEVQSKCGWEPVTIRVDGKERGFVTIPLDENDNLIADIMEQPNNGVTPWAYAGDPGFDSDSVPKGDGTPGDGLTVFEEYRGFVGATEVCKENEDGHWQCTQCGPLKDLHFRTNPAKKDLFIHSPDLFLGQIARNFNQVSGLDVHLICKRHYVNNDERIVNFTLQSKDSAKRWRGKTVSQDQPQHGVYLINEHLPDGKRGISCGLGTSCDKKPWGIGPPRNVKVVKVSKNKIMSGNGWELILARTVFHELGHAVGIQHHGDCNIRGPVVHLDVPTCRNGVKGSVGNRVGCMIKAIAVRHGQNSGTDTCPMKYIQWHWFVPPGKTFKHEGMVYFEYKDPSGKTQREKLPAYTGDLQPYQVHLDKPGLFEFATSNKGTGINDPGLGARNHAGDARRISAHQLRVNDVGATSYPGCWCANHHPPGTPPESELCP